jgi:hypothetical protein
VDEATLVQVPVVVRLINRDPSHPIDGRGAYGYNWWVNGIRADGNRIMPDAPSNTYWSSGAGNNMCFVIPEWKMVVTRLGVAEDPPQGRYVVWNQFFKMLREAIATSSF